MPEGSVFMETWRREGGGRPVDEVHGHIHRVLRIALEAKVVIEHKRQNPTPVVVLGAHAAAAVNAGCAECS